MSRIDTTSFAQSYLGGAQLGTNQFNILANMARAQADARLRRDQFNADQLQQDVSNNQWERQFGRLNENDVFEQGLRSDQFDLDLDQFGLAQQRFGLDRDRFDFSQRAYGNEENRKAAASKVYATMARSLLQRGAAARAAGQGMGAPMSPTAGPPTTPGGQMGAPMGAQMGPSAAMAPSPEDEQWSKMIDSMEWSGDAEALKDVLPFLVDDRKRAEQIQLMDSITSDGFVPEMIPDDTPKNRATRSLLKAFQDAGRPDHYLEAYLRWEKSQQAPIITPDIAAAYGLPPTMIGSPWTSQANQMATQNRYRNRPQGKAGTIRYNPGGNKNKTQLAAVSIGGGQPLVWDPSSPDVQQFLDVARMGMPGRDVGEYDKHSGFVDAVSLGYAGEEGEDDYNARVDKYARQLATTAQWVVHEPGQNGGAGGEVDEIGQAMEQARAALEQRPGWMNLPPERQNDLIASEVERMLGAAR